MNLSFLATILFGLLAIAAAFLANLVVLVFTASQWHVAGVLLAIAAAAASYWAQNQYTVAGYARDTLAAPGAALQAATEAMNRAEGLGQAFQLLAVVLVVGSLVCFWVGMQ